MKRFVLFFSLLFTVAAYGQNGMPVTFHTDFESGRVGEVTLIDSVFFAKRIGDTTTILSYLVKGSFDPENPIDNLSANANWFYFKMKGVAGKDLYLYFPDNYLMNMASYSYDNENWKHFDPKESKPHSLHAQFLFDSVYVALYEPYTYSYAQKRIDDLSQNNNVEVDTIGYSAEERPMQLLHITDNSVSLADKHRVWIHGRIHPSEAPGSYMVDGIIDAFLAETPQAASLRKQIDLYVLPLTNPDGVAEGLSRSNVSGINQEINYDRSDDSTCVEVQCIKKAFAALSEEKPFEIALNSHSQHDGHATFYIHRSGATSEVFLRNQLLFAGLSCVFNPYMRLDQQLFSNGGSRYFEGWVWNNWGARTLALTIETPYSHFCFDTSNVATKESLSDFGSIMLDAISDYLALSNDGRYLVDTPSDAVKSWSASSDCETSFIGGDYLIAMKNNSKITYRLTSLPKGEYAVYMYTGGVVTQTPEGVESINGIDTGLHGWQQIDTYCQRRDGKFKYTFRAAVGTRADAILLLPKN